MSTPDILLIAWWLLTVALRVASLLIALWRRDADNRVSALPRWSIMRTFGTLGDKGAPRLAILAALLCGVIWLAGLVAAVFANHWTALLLLNLYLLITAAGATGIAAGIWLNRFPVVNAMWWRYPRSILRALLVVGGLAVALAGTRMILLDFIAPATVIDGKVDSVTRLLTRGGDRYWIRIDGRRYETLRSVYLATSTGEHIQAEVATGSMTVLHVTPIQ